MARNIFISYSRHDLEKVRVIKEELERETGAECWMDLNAIESGAMQFTQDIVDGIKTCCVFLFMLSKDSQVSKFALRELNFAMKRAEKDKQKRVVIVNVDGCGMCDEFDFMYGLTDMIVWDSQPQKEKLLRDLKRWMGVELAVRNMTDVEKMRHGASLVVHEVDEEKEEEAEDDAIVSDEADTGEGVKTSFSIGTLGHIDHGKTTLSEAICSVLAKKGLGHNYIDSTKEEIINGIRINYAQTEYKSKKHHYTHIDCLNYADYVKGLITRFHLDGAIVVVSATDGPMPQTREHILMARQLNIPRLVVFLNKCDLTKDEDMLELVEMEMLELLMAYGFEDDTPSIRGSALGALNGIAKWENKIVELLDACDTWFPEPVRDIDKPFLMPIEDVFYITGRGAVATGRIETGVVKIGDGVQILGLDESKRAVVTGVEMFRKILDEGEAGDNVGLLLRGVEKDEVKRGMIVTHPDIITPRKKFRASIYVLKAEEGGRHTPFGNKYRPQFYIRTMDLTGEIKLPRGMEMVMPGDNVEISVELIYPVALELGLRFDICEGRRTVGMGVITEIL